MIIMVILVFFLVISVNRRLFRYFGSYSGISVIPVILVNRRIGEMVWGGGGRGAKRLVTISWPNTSNMSAAMKNMS